MSKPRQAIVMMTDTTRWDMLNCYRKTGLKTPHLDRLAAGGIRFERAYTCQPVCGPARSALFTGTYPHTNGSWGNCVSIGAEIKTLGQRIRELGVSAGYIGKWHLDRHDYFGRGHAAPGWDASTWYDMRNYLEELTPEDRKRSRKTSSIQESLPDDFHFAHRCSSRAIEFLNSHKSEDFLLVISYDEPHGPALCPKRFYDEHRNFAFPSNPNVRDTLEDKPEHLKAWAAESKKGELTEKGVVNPAYFGCNAFVDHEIGRVLDAIDRDCPEALLFYTSDHGEMLCAHGITNKGPAMFDEIARIPLLVRWPGAAPAGAVCAHPVSHIDITPTILEFFGAPPSPAVEGRSMLATLRDPVIRPREAVFIEFGRYGVNHDNFGGFQLIRCAFDGRYKLVVNILCSDEFYDLAEDPHEMRNLINSSDHGRERNRLHNLLLDWMNETRDPFRGYYWERRPWRTDARPATWAYTKSNRPTPVEPRGIQTLNYDTGLP